MKNNFLLACACAASLAISIVSCKKDDSVSPSTGNAVIVPITHYSACDSATNMRVNLDTGKPCRCAM